MINLKKRSLQIIVISFIIGMVLTMAFSVSHSRGALKENYENDNRVVAGLISNAIDNYFLRPITVSETISKDYTTKEILNFETKEESEAIEDYAADYFKSLRDGFGYSMVFAVSDRSKAYYSYNGISRYIDIEKNEADLWYKNFLKSEKPYVLDVDTDEANHWSLSVFINTAVKDDSKKLLGVCGVGVDMEELRNILERYERIYDIKINLVNREGLIMVDTDAERIERDNVDIDDLSAYSDGECYYEILPRGCRIITYLDHLDWYLVVCNDNVWTEQITGIVLPGTSCLIICLIILFVSLKLGITGNKEE